MIENRRLLIIGYVWPEPKSSAAGIRMMQLIEIFKDNDWEITFASPAANSNFMFDLESISVNKIAIQLNNKSFDEFILNLMPAAVMYDRFMMEEQFGWRVAEQCPDALRILDTEDLHCLRHARQVAAKEKRLLVQTDLFSDLAKREIASIWRCDCSLIISEYEMKLLHDVYNVSSTLLYYLPLLVEPITKVKTKKYASFEERNHFIFIGNFLHEPNVDAVMFLKKEVWPIIRETLPTDQLHVYGAYPSQKILELNKPQQGFFVMGRVGDAKAVVEQAKISLAPLRIGAGLKGKLIESMQCGTPYITTTIGSEGINGEQDNKNYIADTAIDFATAAIKLYSDKKLWQKAQAKGLQVINSRFNMSLFHQHFMQHIKTLLSNCDAHRLSNFTGSMLVHHLLNSTKYMSKWIEAKNKTGN